MKNLHNEDKFRSHTEKKTKITENSINISITRLLNNDASQEITHHSKLTLPIKIHNIICKRSSGKSETMSHLTEFHRREQIKGVIPVN